MPVTFFAIYHFILNFQQIQSVSLRIIFHIIFWICFVVEFLTPSFNPNLEKTGLKIVEIKPFSPSLWVELKSGDIVEFKWIFEVEFWESSWQLAVPSTSVWWVIIIYNYFTGKLMEFYFTLGFQGPILPTKHTERMRGMFCGQY